MNVSVVTYIELQMRTVALAHVETPLQELSKSQLQREAFSEQGHLLPSFPVVEISPVYAHT